MSPSLEVSHLASSTSFYSAILQPLGLHFIAPPDEERGAVAKLSSSSAFGLGEEDVLLEIQQSENPLKPPKLSSIVISAPSSSAVAGFHSAWKKADPPLWSKFRDRRGLEKHFDDLNLARSGPWQTDDPRSGSLITRAVVYDLDGNRCEVVHQQSHHRSQRSHEPPRIVDWAYDVEATPARTSSRISLRKNSAGNSQRPAAIPAAHHESPFSAGSRSAFAPAAMPNAAEESASPRQSSRQGGLNTTTVVGALLGAAAGAALTYGFVSSNSRDSSAEATERHRAPPRRATFPDKPVTGTRHQSYHENGVMQVDNYRDHKTPRKLAYPDFQALSIRGGGYGDGDEDVDYGKNPWLDVQSPRYLTQGPPPAQSVVTKSRPPSTFRPPVEEQPYERRSRPSSRSQAPAPTVRARSETPRERVPASAVDDYTRGGQRSHRTVVGDYVAPPREPPAGYARSTVSRSRRSSVYNGPEHDTFVTAPTHRSSAPSRHHDYEYGGGREAMPRSRAPSQVSTSTVKERARAPPSHAAVSRTSARRVALPMSGASSSHAPWDARDIALPKSGVGSSHANWDDDLESVAPSDSISCVGSKHSRRTRRYHH